METKVFKIAAIHQNESLAVLLNGDENLPGGLSPEEQLLWNNRPEKNPPVLIQRLPNMLFLVKPDLSKPHFQVLETYRKAGAKWMETVKTEKIKELTIAGFTEDTHLLAFTEGFLMAGYSFHKYKKEKDDFMPAVLNIFHDRVSQDQLDELSIVMRAVWWARDLVNEPLSHLTAIGLAEEIVAKGGEAGFLVEVFHKQKIESLKMGGLLAVNKGSIDPPTFTVMEWKPENAVNNKPIIFAGKGVVYDTGGLSLKPTPKSMDYMKCDMAGAAAVAATIYAAALSKLPVHIIGLVPATDNRPDGNACVPGDIITMFDGTTVEVVNTDAEGRLLLADALSYAKKYDPLLAIDLATLTGAASIIAGNHGIVAMGNSSVYLEKLKYAGEEVCERLVEMPLWEEFGQSLKSDVADLSNLGAREGQTIVAGKFLEHFTDYPWIHLDIAGTAWLFEKDAWRPKGGTGSGIRLLYNFLKKL
jgi:leucyl aminopeptidase